MAYNETLAARIVQALEGRKVSFNERNMFGGLFLLVDHKKLMGVEKARPMHRIDPDNGPKALKIKSGHPESGYKLKSECDWKIPDWLINELPFGEGLLD